VSGIVLDGAGKPVSVNVGMQVDEERGQGMGLRTSTKSGADGRFEWKGLGRHRYLLVISDADWANLPVPVDLRQGDVSDVVVRVESGTLVHLRSAWPAAETRDVRLITADGLPIRNSHGWPGDYNPT